MLGVPSWKPSACVLVLWCLTGGSAHPRVPGKTALQSWRTPWLLQPWMEDVELFTTS